MQQFISAAETTKQIKAKLTKQFNHTFSVTNRHRYVSIRWTDGPSQNEVSAAVEQFRPYTFDGFDDSRTRKSGDVKYDIEDIGLSSKPSNDEELYQEQCAAERA